MAQYPVIDAFHICRERHVQTCMCTAHARLPTVRTGWCQARTRGAAHVDVGLEALPLHLLLFHGCAAAVVLRFKLHDLPPKLAPPFLSTTQLGVELALMLTHVLDADGFAERLEDRVLALVHPFLQRGRLQPGKPAEHEAACTRRRERVAARIAPGQTLA